MLSSSLHIVACIPFYSHSSSLSHLPYTYLSLSSLFTALSPYLTHQICSCTSLLQFPSPFSLSVFSFFYPFSFHSTFSTSIHHLPHPIMAIGEPQLATAFFNMVRGWVVELRSLVHTTQEVNKASMNQVWCSKIVHEEVLLHFEQVVTTRARIYISWYCCICITNFILFHTFVCLITVLKIQMIVEQSTIGLQHRARSNR